ncbi:hypothetical protein ALC62_00977 [Cyphomyrmex costatus]|uniref:Uncharacterized protein n=1 Tax=Cyphomyrmex costatus TaxID=456900 RepID=A0A195D5I2_9HYME|nr:hypothetical protein ALC62_00977 [Cyphomyrmex costatus]
MTVIVTEDDSFIGVDDARGAISLVIIVVTVPIALGGDSLLLLRGTSPILVVKVLSKVVRNEKIVTILERHWLDDQLPTTSFLERQFLHRQAVHISTAFGIQYTMFHSLSHRHLVVTPRVHNLFHIRIDNIFVDGFVQWIRLAGNPIDDTAGPIVHKTLRYCVGECDGTTSYPNGHVHLSKIAADSLAILSNDLSRDRIQQALSHRIDNANSRGGGITSTTVVTTCCRYLNSIRDVGPFVVELLTHRREHRHPTV